MGVIGHASRWFQPIGLKKVFDSVHRGTFSNFLQLHVILSIGLSSGSESAVKCEDRGEAGLHPCLITFQHLYGQGIRQSCGPTIIGNTRVIDLVTADGSWCTALEGCSCHEGVKTCQFWNISHTGNPQYWKGLHSNASCQIIKCQIRNCFSSHRKSK